MRRFLASLVCGAAVFGAGAALAAGQTLIWANYEPAGGDMSRSESYILSSGATYTEKPDGTDVIFFRERAKVQPFLSESLEVRALNFSPYLNTTDRNVAAVKQGVDNSSGYVITGKPGCVLTLTGTGSSANNIAIDGFTSGTNIVDVPIAFSGASPYVGGTGHYLILKQPVVITGNPYTRDFVIYTGKVDNDSKFAGVCCFAASNPDFKPKRFDVSGQARFAIGHPEALCAVSNICTTGWGGNPYWINATDGPVCFDSVSQWDPGWRQGYSGLENLVITGSPIIMSNCEWRVSFRGNKSREIDAALTLKNLYANDENNAYFVQTGTNMLEVLEETQEAAGLTDHLSISDGMFYPHKLQGGAIRDSRRFLLSGTDGSQFPTLGVGADAQIPLNYLGGLAFCNTDGTSQRSGGFSGMGGDWKVTLVDPATRNPLTLTKGTKTAAGSGYIAPTTWVFGNVSATGTASLMNDCDFQSSNGNVVWAIKGSADVDGRFMGKVTFSASGTKKLTKRGSGVISFAHPPQNESLNAASTVEAGGLLINADWRIAGLSWTVNGGAFIGGDGFVNQVTVNAGGAVTGGDCAHGGVFCATGIKWSEGSGIHAHFRGGTAGTIRLTGELSSYTAPGSGKIFVKVDSEADPPVYGKAKLIDWEGCAGNSDTHPICQEDTYELDYDHEAFDSVTLVKTDTALWINYSRVLPGFKVMIR